MAASEEGHEVIPMDEVDGDVAVVDAAGIHLGSRSDLTHLTLDVQELKSLMELRGVEAVEEIRDKYGGIKEICKRLFTTENGGKFITACCGCGFICFSPLHRAEPLYGRDKQHTQRGGKINSFRLCIANCLDGWPYSIAFTATMSYWSYFLCLVATAAVILNERPDRTSLGTVKQFLSSKYFGTK